MTSQFQAIIAAGVQHAKAHRSKLLADEFARRIASYTPLAVSETAIAEEIEQEAVRVGVAVAYGLERDGLLPADAPAAR